MSKKINSQILAWAVLAFLAAGQAVFAQQKVDGYEYWFDQDIAARQFVSQSPDPSGQILSQVAVASLPLGFHILHLRFRKNVAAPAPQWSSVSSYRFFKTSVEGGRAWQYWWDDKIAQAQTLPANNDKVFILDEKVPTDQLSDGFHTLHLRMLEQGGWTSVSSFRFFKDSKSQPQGVQGYEFWFDGKFDQRVFKVIANYPPNGVLSLDSVDLTGLGAGLDTFCIRFLGMRGWTSATCYKFLTSSNEDLAAALGLQIFPNPTARQFKISVSEKTPTTISLFDALGRLVERRDSPSREEQFSVSGAGVFFVKIDFGEGQSVVQKVVVSGE